MVPLRADVCNDDRINRSRLRIPVRSLIAFDGLAHLADREGCNQIDAAGSETPGQGRVGDFVDSEPRIRAGQPSEPAVRSAEST
jgi:hypothetical protein